MAQKSHFCVHMAENLPRAQTLPKLRGEAVLRTTNLPLETEGPSRLGVDANRRAGQPLQWTKPSERVPGGYCTERPSNKVCSSVGDLRLRKRCQPSEKFAHLCKVFQYCASCEPGAGRWACGAFFPPSIRN